jgi:hypothetical protein
MVRGWVQAVEFRGGRRHFDNCYRSLMSIRRVPSGVTEMVDISYMESKKMVSFFYSMNYDDEIPEETGYETGPPIPCFSSTPG